MLAEFCCRTLMEPSLTANSERAPRALKPLLLSFSGIDGAGKTTQIENTIALLEAAGMKVRIIRFWDDIASFRRLRESLGHALFRGEKGIGAPGKPVRRRDKDVRSWYMLPVRMGLCFFDTLNLALSVSRIQNSLDADAVIFDRYVYDQFANLELRSRPIRGYLAFLLKVVPRPDIAFLLDADPELARARKPEYPLEFLHVNRQAYLELSRLAGMTVISPGTPEEVKSAIQRALAGPRAKLGLGATQPPQEILVSPGQSLE